MTETAIQALHTSAEQNLTARQANGHSETGMKAEYSRTVTCRSSSFSEEREPSSPEEGNYHLSMARLTDLAQQNQPVINIFKV